VINWRKYNQSLVKRGEIMLGFDIIDNWDNELEEMNKGKVGEPYHSQFISIITWICKSVFSSPIQAD
jgi:hypothetical protein